MIIEILTAVAVFILTIAVRFFAFPGEVTLITRKILRQPYLLKLNLLSTLLYISWMIYGLIKKDLIIILAQGAGLITSVVLTIHIIRQHREP